MDKMMHEQLTKIHARKTSICKYRNNIVMAIYGVLIAISTRAVLNVLVAYMVNCEQFLLWLKVNTIGILSLLLRNDSVVKNGIF